jgi:hypothetical protein
MGLGEAADVDHLVRDPPAQADWRARRDGPGRVVLNDWHAGLGKDGGQVPGTRLGHRRPRRIVSSGLQEHGCSGAAQSCGQRLGKQSGFVDRHPHHLHADGLEQVQQRREAGVLHHYPVAKTQQRA